MSVETAHQQQDIPYLDISDPAFAMQSEQLRDARERSWYARTNYGIAVLRYDEVSKLLKSPKLIQGSAKWPAHNGVHGGLFFDWWTKNLLVLEGEDHHRIRRLLNPAFSPRLIKDLVPRFQDLANELVDAFIDKGACEFVADFAEPYATRVLTILLGIPETEWPTIARLASTVGLALGVTFKQDLDKVDAAVAELYAYAEDLIRDRQREPGRGLRLPPGAGQPRRRQAQRRRTARRAGPADLRRHGHHPQPAGPGHADVHAQPATSGTCWPNARSSAARPWRRSCGSTRPSRG